MEFGAWVELTPEGLEKVPEAPGAVQLRRKEGLIDYPTGKSAMVFYAFVASGVRPGLQRAFADELGAPGARGQGPLLVRWSLEPGARDGLEQLLAEFERRFGRPPVLHQQPQQEGT